MAAAHIRNRMPCSSNPNNASPFEMRFGRKPDMCHLRPFGVTAFVRIQKHITKISPRAVKGIFLGYGHTISNQKGWRVLLTDTNKVITTTNVKFESSISASIARRNRSLVSTDPFTVDSNSDAARSVPLSSPLPTSLQLRPRNSASHHRVNHLCPPQKRSLQLLLLQIPHASSTRQMWMSLK